MNVAADELWPGPTLGDQAVENVNGGVGVDPAVDLDRQGLAGVLVDHVQQLQDPTVQRLVELVVQRPHMVRVLGRQPVGRTGRGTEALAFAAAGRHAQAFLAPQALDGLAVHCPAPAAKLGMGAPIAPPWMGAAELAQRLAEGPVPIRLDRLVALGGAVLPDQPARPPLGHPKYLLEVAKQLEVSEATYHRWRAQYGGLKADDVRRLKELEGENARLKRIVADKELQIQALKELGRGNW